MIKKTLGGIILVLLGVTATVYGISLFTQTFPPVPATAHVLTQNCFTLTSKPSEVAPGSSGGVSFGCDLNPAFTVLNDGVSIPVFTLPAPYANVTIINSAAGPTGGCSTFSGRGALTNGTPFPFTGAYGKGNSYNYCVAYTSATGNLTQFAVTWTQ